MPTHAEDTDLRLRLVAEPVLGYLRNITQKKPNRLSVETVVACAGMLIESFIIRNRALREERDALQALIDAEHHRQDMKMFKRMIDNPVYSDADLRYRLRVMLRNITDNPTSDA